MGAASPGRTDRTVPEFGDDLMMYAKTTALRAHPGCQVLPAARRASHAAFERHLAAGDFDTLWAYVVWLRSPAGRELRVDSTAAMPPGVE